MRRFLLKLGVWAAIIIMVTLMQVKVIGNAGFEKVIGAINPTVGSFDQKVENNTEASESLEKKQDSNEDVQNDMGNFKEIENSGASPQKLISGTTTIDVRIKGDLLYIINGDMKIEYDLKKGLANYYWMGIKTIEGIYSTVKIDGTGTLKNTDYKEHHLREEKASVIQDGYGRGIRLSIDNTGDKLPEMIQEYTIYEDKPYFFTSLTIRSDKEEKSNYMAPISAGDFSAVGRSVINIGSAGDSRVLLIPYDNDNYVRYQSNYVRDGVESYEVSAIYENSSRRGLVMGSITHGVWKSAVKVTGNPDNTVKGITIYGGVANSSTRDTQPHGSIKGKELVSPKIFIGLYDDYRTGLEDFGKANAVTEAPLKWEEGVPFGWNSWAALKDKVNYDEYIKASDFIKQNLQNNEYDNKAGVYINFDSYWDNLSEAQIKAAVKYVHDNGQKAGIYWTPFTCWSSALNYAVEGTGNKYNYSDIVMKDDSGKVLPKLDGGYALDPTHPGTLARMNRMINKFVEWGFDYIKLDFLVHGSLEGSHYEKDITTGTQAYNYGMQYMKDLLNPERIGRKIFINEAISPLFPYQYAHSRRISCDTFGSITDTEYLLNSVTYGWWMNNSIYRYNDPDQTVLFKSFDSTDTKEKEAQSRLNASIISGTVLLDGDNFNYPGAVDRVRKLLTNKSINDIARMGNSFSPIEGDTSSKAADSFVLEDKVNKQFYLAVFNYSGSVGIEKKIDFGRAGITGSGEFDVSDLWTGDRLTISGSMKVKLEAAQSKIFKIVPK